MGDLKTINAREANQRFSELLSRVEKDGCGFLVTKRSRPVARLLPVEAADRLTPERKAALERLLASARPLGVGRLNRDELHERR